MSQERLNQFFRALGRSERILILPHNNPDPDAIASAVALRYLLAEKLQVEGHIAYRGIIGRAENRALVRYLSHPLQLLSEDDLGRSLPVVFVDTQPGAGNNPAPPEARVIGVIDHHAGAGMAGPGFVDVRPEVGATSTILTDYLRLAEVDLSTPLVTALFYGIKTNTLSLARNSGPMDADAYYFLQPLIDVEALAKIENAKVPPLYFRSFDLALRAARVYEGVVISYVGVMVYPDLAAEMADLLLRLEEARWVICMGVYGDDLIVSVRTRRRFLSAEGLVQAVIGSRGTAGGHGTMAGGQFGLAGQAVEQVVEQVTAQILGHLNIPEGLAGKPLI